MERRISTISLVVLLLSMGLVGVRSSRAQRALAEPGPRPVSDAPWGANVQVSDDTSGAWQGAPAIAVDGSGNAYAVWKDTRNDDGDIYFSYRPAGGDWGANVKVSDDAGTSEQWKPAIAVDGRGNAYAVWGDWRNGDPSTNWNCDIYFSYRPAGGDWGANVKVSDDAGTSSQWVPAIAVDGAGNAYAVWDDFRNGPWGDIYFSYRPAGGDWGSNMKVNDDTGRSRQLSPAIALDGSGNAYAVWQDLRNGNWDIYFSYRPAGGDWGPNVKVSDDPGTAWQLGPVIALDGGGNAYAVWGDERNGDYDIYFSYRPAGGDWGPNVKVNDDAGRFRQGTSAIAVDGGGNAYAVWEDERNGNEDIYFSYRPAGGDWGPNVKVNDDAGISAQRAPAIAVDGGGNAYAVWHDERNGNWDIYFSYRAAEGVTPTPTPTVTVSPTAIPTPQLWLENVQVSDDTSGTKQAHPAIAVDGSGSTYAVWTDTRYGDYDIYFSYRPAGGDWGPSVKVSDDTSGAWQGTAATAVDASGNAYAVWKDARNGDYDIYFSYRPAGGDWAPNVRVNDDAGTSDQWNPAIAVDGSGNAYAVWEDHRKANDDINVDIYFSYRPAGGDWGPNLKVNDDTSGALQMVPAIALDSSGNAYAVWQDTRNGDYYDMYDIYFSYRPAGGDWGPNAKVNDDTSVGVQESPAIAVDGSGNAYGVWGDYRSANGDIYFSYRPAGGDWGPDVKVDDAAWGALQTAPAIALDSSGNAYAVWEDFRNDDYDIYFSYRPAGGDWGPNVKVNDDAGTSTQWFPAIAVDGSGNAYAVWMDERKGNFDIYFSYRPAEGVTPTPTPTATPTPTPTATRTPVAILTPQLTPIIAEATPAPTPTPTPLQTPSPTATPYYEEGWLTARSVLVLAALLFCGGVTALIILVVGFLVLRKR